MSNWIAVGHRGAPRESAANTLESFQRAMDLGCEMVECDIRRAADGILVLAHDPEVGHWEVARTESKILATEHKVPTLAEFMDWAVHSGASVMADMKVEGDGVEEAVVAALSKLPIDKKLVPGASFQSRERFRSLDPSLPLSLSHSGPLDNDEFEALLPQIDTPAVTWHYSLLDQERIARLQARGLRVFVWTVDEPAQMEHFLTWGVDGLISNNTRYLGNLRRESRV